MKPEGKRVKRATEPINGMVLQAPKDGRPCYLGDDGRYHLEEEAMIPPGEPGGPPREKHAKFSAATIREDPIHFHKREQEEHEAKEARKRESWGTLLSIVCERPLSGEGLAIWLYPIYIVPMLSFFFAMAIILWFPWTFCEWARPGATDDEGNFLHVCYDPRESQAERRDQLRLVTNRIGKGLEGPPDVDEDEIVDEKRGRMTEQERKSKRTHTKERGLDFEGYSYEYEPLGLWGFLKVRTWQMYELLRECVHAARRQGLQVLGMLAAIILGGFQFEMMVHDFNDKKVGRRRFPFFHGSRSTDTLTERSRSMSTRLRGKKTSTDRSRPLRIAHTLLVQVFPTGARAARPLASVSLPRCISLTSV